MLVKQICSKCRKRHENNRPHRKNDGTSSGLGNILFQINWNDRVLHCHVAGKRISIDGKIPEGCQYLMEQMVNADD
jgi:hypothetical protein